MGFLDKLFGGGKRDVVDTATAGKTIMYRVGPNETCRTVAKKFFGDESQWQKVYDPNLGILKDEVQSGSDTLLVGTELTIKDAQYDLDGQPVS